MKEGLTRMLRPAVCDLVEEVEWENLGSLSWARAVRSRPRKLRESVKVDGRYFGQIVILVGVRICSIYGKTGEGVR